MTILPVLDMQGMCFLEGNKSENIINVFDRYLSHNQYHGKATPTSDTFPGYWPRAVDLIPEVLWL